MLMNFPFMVVMALIVIGLYAVLTKKDIIKIIIGIQIMETGVNLFLITLGYRMDSVAPIFTSAPGKSMVFPTVQALTLTSIVIGVATVALMLSFAMLIYKHNGSLSAEKLRRLQG
jgi:multicomponent Na+:H+ antiporter subunit C